MILRSYINLIYIFFITKVKFKNYKQKTASVAGKEEIIDAVFHRCTRTAILILYIK